MKLYKRGKTDEANDSVYIPYSIVVKKDNDYDDVDVDKQRVCTVCGKDQVTALTQLFNTEIRVLKFSCKICMYLLK